MGLRSISTGANNLSRREFLKLMGAALLSSCNLEFSGQDREIASKLVPSIEQTFGIHELHLVERPIITANYEIHPIEYGHLTITGNLKNFYSELCKYPPEFYENIRELNWGIYLGKDLIQIIDGELFNVDGFSFKDINGNPRIVIDIFNTLRVSALVLHHDMFHQISDNSPLVTNNALMTNIDDSLLSIDREHGLPSHQYQHYGEVDNCTDSNPLGFASCYGQWNPDEDGAEIAKSLMTGDLNLWKRSQTDKALREKMIQVMNMYEFISNGKMNEIFFSELTYGYKNFWGWPEIPR